VLKKTLLFATGAILAKNETVCAKIYALKNALLHKEAKGRHYTIVMFGNIEKIGELKLLPKITG
jgi:hypothetical protein